jgi:hypothetical protein
MYGSVKGRRGRDARQQLATAIRPRSGDGDGSLQRRTRDGRRRLCDQRRRPVVPHSLRDIRASAWWSSQAGARRLAAV